MIAPEQHSIEAAGHGPMGETFAIGKTFKQNDYII